MFKAGDVVFFKAAKRGTKRSLPEGKFKGHGFGVLLGQVPPFEKDPPADQLLRLMGSIGFVSFDDIGEFFGDEGGARCLSAFEAKYYAQPKGPSELPPVEKGPAPIDGVDDPKEGVTGAGEGGVLPGASESVPAGVDGIPNCTV